MSFQEPIGLGALDLTSVRVALAAIVWLQFLRRDAHLSGGPEPVGLARLGNFAFLEDRRRRTLLRVLSTAVAAAFAAGVALPLVAAWLALYVMTAGALISSHGGVLHSSQAVALAILAHASALVMNYGETGLWSGAPTPGSLAAQTTALAWSQQAFLAVYFTSGITKLNRSTWQWVRRSPYLLAPILKSIDEKY